ncbi:cysteine-rich CWC family protein [Emticicia sp. 17c]|uniref:cysteine-rich CWC family protein n=1 Tax=Emticicia sp. 17c TaxID=3127704 RepID=UPI00301B7943
MKKEQSAAEQPKANVQEVCPRCQQIFMCQASDISQCQCRNVCLTKPQSEYINQQYTTCLCAACLQILQHEYEQTRG